MRPQTSQQPCPPRPSAADWNLWLLDKGSNDADGGFGTGNPGGISRSHESSPAFDPDLKDQQGDFDETGIGKSNTDNATDNQVDHDLTTLTTAAAEICRLLKKKKNLTAESEAELDVYVSVLVSFRFMTLLCSNIWHRI